MNNRVRVESDENVVKNAAVYLRDPDDAWVDVRHAVTAAVVTLKVGEVSVVHLDLIPAEATVEGYMLDDETLRAFAHMLRVHGWDVREPVTV